METQNKDLLQNAIDKVTIGILDKMSYGEEIELNEEYTLYHYIEDDIIVLVKTEEWEEIYQFLYDDNEITLEAL